MEERPNGGGEPQDTSRLGPDGPGSNGQSREPAAGLPEGKAPAPPSPAAVVRMALVFYGLLAMAGFAWRALLAGEPILYASATAEASGLHPLRDLGAGLLGAGIIVAISWEFTRRTRAGDSLARVLASVLGPLSLPQCLTLALVSGVAEEVFFRGALQPRVGLVAASLLFGLAHFAPRRDLLPWTGFSILAGLLLGTLFEATGNLLAPVTAHTVINAVNLSLLVRHYGTPRTPDSGG